LFRYQQEAAEAVVAAVFHLDLEAGHEGALDRVIDAVGDLVAEEVAHHRKVALEQQVARRSSHASSLDLE
jgi:hypothetical protein